MKTTTNTLTSKQTEVLNAIINTLDHNEEGDAVWVDEINQTILNKATKDKTWEKMVKEGYIEITPDPDANRAFVEITTAAYELLKATTTTSNVIIGLTPLEKQTLKAFIGGLYAEAGFSDIDAKDLAKTTGIELKKLRGVLSSLVKKGIVNIEGVDGEGEWGNKSNQFFIIYLSNDYFFLHEEWSKESGIEYKPLSEETVQHMKETKVTEKLVSISEKPSSKPAPKTKNNVDWSTFSYQQLAKEYGKDFVGKSKQQLIDLLSK